MPASYAYLRRSMTSCRCGQGRRWAGRWFEVALDGVWGRLDCGLPGHVLLPPSRGVGTEFDSRASPRRPHGVCCESMPWRPEGGRFPLCRRVACRTCSLSTAAFRACATYFLCFAKESKQRKGHPRTPGCATALLEVGGLRNSARGPQQFLALYRQLLRCSAPAEGPKASRFLDTV